MKNDLFVKIISHLGGEAPATTVHSPTLLLPTPVADDTVLASLICKVSSDGRLLESCEVSSNGDLLESCEDLPS